MTSSVFASPTFSSSSFAHVPAWQKRNFLALDQYQILPQALHHVEAVDYRSTIADMPVASPVIGYWQQHQHYLTADTPMTLLVEGERWLESQNNVQKNFQNKTQGHMQEQARGHIIAQLEPQRMGQLMPLVKRLSSLEKYHVSAICLDLSPLAYSHPYGQVAWRPRGREEIAELKAAATCPLWLNGIASPHDAEIAAEAGVDAIIVNNHLGAHVDTPATIDIFSEIFDAVAGMTSILVASGIRHGLDIFRYLAVGAEAVVSHSDRDLLQLHEELRYVMRLTGCATLADISYDAVYVPLFREP